MTTTQRRTHRALIIVDVQNDFRAHLRPGLHAGVAPETSSAALREMAARGVVVDEGVLTP